MRRRLVATLIVCLLALPALASAQVANRWVDVSCSFDGNGQADSCAASGGASGRWNNLQTALTAAVADNVIEVYAGDYVTANGASYTNASGFAFANSGTSGHPITLRNKPGNRPGVRACSSGVAQNNTNCERPTMTLYNQQYIVITSSDCPTNGPVGTLGLHIYGMLALYADSVTAATQMTNSVTCTEMERGWANGDPTGDGNWTTLFLQGQRATVRWNYLHGVSVLNYTGEDQQSSRAGVKMFTSAGSLIADNLIDGVANETGGEGYSNNFGVGIDCKADCATVTIERNDIRNVSIGIRIENQETGGSDWAAAGVTGTIIRNNVLVSDTDHLRGCFRFEDGIVTDILLHNNTCVGFSLGLEDNHTVSGTCNGITTYNNAFASIVSKNWDLLAFGPCTVVASDYDIFTSSPATPRYRYLGTNRNALTDLQGATSFNDSHSSEIANAAFLFTNAGAGDYTLQAGSPLVNTGKTGGIAAGASINVGAYTTTVTCVGYLCGATAISSTRMPFIRREEP